MTKAFKSPVNIPTGSVGGLVVSSSGLNNQGAGSSYAGFQSASTASYAFFAGGQNTSGSAAPFYVTPAGTLTANSASISGVVNFTSGSVGPFTISLLSLTSASGAITASTASFANINLINTSSATVPLTIVGASGQSANLQEWKNSSGTTVSYVTSGGTGYFAQLWIPTSGVIANNVDSAQGKLQFSTSGPIISTTTASNVTLTLKSASAQSANIQQWQNSSGSVLANVNASGGANFASGSIGGLQIFAGNSDIYYIALGASALQNWANGNYNTYSIVIGYQANANLSANNGGNSIVIGYQALYSASTSGTSQNVAIGNAAMTGNPATGINTLDIGNSVAIGWHSMYLTKGSIQFATAIGTQSMQSASGGNGNTAIGNSTMGSINGGNYNTSLGANSGKVTSVGSYNLSLGYNVYPTSGSINGTVQIGTDSGGVAATASADNQIILGTVNHSTIIPGAASVGGNPVTTSNIIRGQNHTTAGSIDTMSRLQASGATTLNASTAYYTFFTATENISASSISIYTSNSITATTRFGLYTVSNADSSTASVTLVARSTLTSVTYSGLSTTTQSFDTTGGYPSSYTLTAGSRYAVGCICYGNPTAAALTYASGLSANILPIMSKAVASQSDLTIGPTTISSMGNSSNYLYFRINGTLA